MEIFHAFGVDYRLLLIQIVNFGVLLLVLWKFLYKPLLKMMDDRQAMVAKGVTDAHEAKRKLAQAEEEKRALLTSATKDADMLIDQARKEASDKERQATQDAEVKASRILAEAESISADMKKKALDESKQEVAKLIVLGMEKALKSK